MTLWSALAWKNESEAQWRGRFMLCHEVGNISKSNEKYGGLCCEFQNKAFNVFKSLFIQIVHCDFLKIITGIKHTKYTLNFKTWRESGTKQRCRHYFEVVPAAVEGRWCNVKGQDHGHKPPPWAFQGWACGRWAQSSLDCFAPLVARWPQVQTCSFLSLHGAFTGN